MSDTDLDELAAELSEFAAPEKAGGRPPREERAPVASVAPITAFDLGNAKRRADPLRANAGRDMLCNHPLDRLNNQFTS